MLIELIVSLMVVGILLWLINEKLPMDGAIKEIINIVALVAVLVWILRAVGMLGGVTLF